MIESKNGTLKMEGTVIHLMVEYSAITNALKNNLKNKVGLSEEKANEEMKYIFETGLCSEKELDERIRESIKGNAENIASGILAAMLSAIFEE